MSSVGGDYVDPGDCSELTLEQLFAADVYRWRERCYPCHFSSDQQVAAPKWVSDTSGPTTNPTLACASGSLATMRTLLSRGYVNLSEPTQSLFLLKPLSAEGSGVQHGGGQKFANTNDPTYQSVLAWIGRYGACALQDPSLPKPAAPPPTAAASDAGPGYSIYDYCNCLLAHCHDQAHVKWGDADEAVLAGCRAEAVDLPASSAASASGDSLECRVMYCEQAKLTSQACSAALGETICL